MTKKLLVPMRAGGRKGTGMLHDTKYARGANSVEEAVQINSGIANPAWHVDYIWTEAKIFTARLRYAGHYRHKSAAWFYFVDEATGAQWPMFMSDLDDVLSGGDMIAGTLAEATYEPYKRGNAYGIRQKR